MEHWSSGLGLSSVSCAAPKECTWADAEVWLDDKGVSARLDIEGISAMLSLETLMRLVRLNMRAWQCRADVWN